MSWYSLIHKTHPNVVSDRVNPLMAAALCWLWVFFPTLQFVVGLYTLSCWGTSVMWPLGRWVISRAINMNVRSQSFPLNYCTTLRYPMLFNCHQCVVNNLFCFWKAFSFCLFTTVQTCFFVCLFFSSDWLVEWSCCYLHNTYCPCFCCP